MGVYESDVVFDALMGDADLVVVRLGGEDEGSLVERRWWVCNAGRQEARTLPTARACQMSEPGKGSASRRSSSAQATEDGSMAML